MREMWLFVLGSLFVAGQAFADDLATALVGRWVVEGKALEFYGQGIGRSLADTTQYVKYDLSADGQIIFTFGGGTTEQCSISITNGELHLADTNQQETVYAKVATNLNPCVRNLRQLDGAISLFASEHDGMAASNPSDLIPAYLTTLPTCPDGGIYTPAGPGGHPVCSIPEHALGP